MAPCAMESKLRCAPHDGLFESSGRFQPREWRRVARPDGTLRNGIEAVPRAARWPLAVVLSSHAGGAA
eukprot:8581650-Alexandrium_andersonii.AAC.1